MDPKAENEDGMMGGSVMINTIASVLSGLVELLAAPKLCDKSIKGIFSKVDIAGYNYGHKAYQKHHEWHPNRIMVGTETHPTAIYDN